MLRHQVKRILLRIFLVVFCAVNVAVAVMIWRAPDPSYRMQELLAMGRYHEFDDLITRAARKYGVDPMLVKAVVWRESRFQAEKIGAAGERGLMQVGFKSHSRLVVVCQLRGSWQLVFCFLKLF